MYVCYVCMYIYVCICMSGLGLEYEDNAEQYNTKAVALSSSSFTPDATPGVPVLRNRKW